jgi:dolichol-phosphate mannosyltransferase
MSYSLISVPLGTFQVNELLFAESVDESNFDQVSQLLEKSVKFSLIVPTYNESKNLAKLVEILTQLLNNYR